MSKPELDQRSRRHVPVEMDRSPERQALAEAIESHREAAEVLADVENAKTKNDESRRAAFWTIENFDAVIEEAKTNAAEHLIGSGAAPKSIKQVRADRQDADDTMETCKLTAIALDKKAGRARMSLDLARCRVEDASRRVIATSPAVVAMFDEYAALKRRQAGLRKLLSVFSSAVPDPHKHWDNITDDADDLGAAAQWRASIAALQFDPDAALPTE